MKKLCALLLAFTVCLPAFAGGGQQSRSQGTAAPVARGTLPLTTENITLSMFMSINANNATTSYDYEDNDFTRRIVNETGIKMEFIAVATADSRTRLNAMLASGEYPDLLMKQSLSIADLSYWGSQGVFMPLDEFNIQSYPNIKAIMDEYPEVMKVIQGADGKTYGLPSVNDCLHCTYGNGRAWYYMPWIRDTGRKLPETVPEFTDFLRWLRDSDLNKNGRKDEAPVAFAATKMNAFIAFVAKAYMPFIYNRNNSYVGFGLTKNKQIWEQYRDNEFRQALSTIAGWYKEGLIAPNSFTMSDEQFRAMVHNDEPIVGLGFQEWAPGRQPSDRWAEYWHLKPLLGPSGNRWAGNNDPWSIYKQDMVITTNCEHPELAIALYDYLLNFEVMMDGYIGPKGEAWNYPDPGSLSLKGDTPMYKMLVNYMGQRVNGGWNQANPMNQNTAFRLGEQAIEYDIAKKWWETGDPSLRDRVVANSSYNEEANWYWANQDIPWTIPLEYFIPPFAFNDLDNDRVSDIKAVLDPYQQMAWSEFITGRRDINSDAVWNAYLADLDRMGSKDMAAIYQKYIK